MNTLRTTVGSFLRFLAAGLILLALALLALAYTARRQDESSLWFWVGGGLSGIIGLLLLVFSAPLAKKLTADYE
jgi:drug/metabolite transporter (DMT)-like permease